jgi:hypothetical protein
MEISKPDKVTIPERVLTDAEALSIMKRILDGEGSDEQLGIWIEQLIRATGCPHILGLIRQWKPPETAADVLRRAREYRPIQL